MVNGSNESGGGAFLTNIDHINIDNDDDDDNNNNNTHDENKHTGLS